MCASELSVALHCLHRKALRLNILIKSTTWPSETFGGWLLTGLIHTFSALTKVCVDFQETLHFILYAFRDTISTSSNAFPPFSNLCSTFSMQPKLCLDHVRLNSVVCNLHELRSFLQPREVFILLRVPHDTWAISCTKHGSILFYL